MNIKLLLLLLLMMQLLLNLHFMLLLLLLLLFQLVKLVKLLLDKMAEIFYFNTIGGKFISD
jgi:hypothetical protein